MKNPRLALAGLIAIAAGAALFFYFRNNQDGATDPVELMRVVGQVAGIVAGLGLALVAMSFFVGGRKRK
jgi:hypothetical protein